MTTGLVVQARQNSSRFPDKVLMDLHGKPMLVRELERLQQVNGIDRVIVATTENVEDDAIENCVSGLPNIDLVRGSESDVLDRFARAASRFNLDIIGRVTGDCPLIDPGVVSRVLNRFMATSGCDYASNCRPRTYPHGFDVEFISRAALDTAAAEAIEGFDREHVLVYIFTKPERFTCVNVEAQDAQYKTLRLTVDYPDDLSFVREVYARLYPENPSFSFAEIMELVDHYPELLEINRHVPSHESITEAAHRNHPRAVSANAITGEK